MGHGLILKVKFGRGVGCTIYYPYSAFYSYSSYSKRMILVPSNLKLLKYTGIRPKDSDSPFLKRQVISVAIVILQDDAVALKNPEGAIQGSQ
jgi:hypothetical protein